MSDKNHGENPENTQEKNDLVNSNPLKGYAWRDAQEVRLKNGDKIILIKNSKNNFGFLYIDKYEVYHPELSQESGITGPEEKNSPFLLFGNTIMEAGEEIPEKKEEGEAEETKENPPIEETVNSKKKIKISPAVKKIATEKGLTEENLQEITGTGKGNNITKKDIENYLKENSTPKGETADEWKEVSDDTRITIFEEGEITIKKGTEFYIEGIKYIVTSIKEHDLSDDEAEYEIKCSVSGKDIEPGSVTIIDPGELEDAIKNLFDSVNGDKKDLRKVLFTPPNSNVNKILTKKNEEEKFEKEIKINGFVFVAGKTTFQSDGELFRVDKIKEVGHTRMDWELTVSKIDPITKDIIEQKQKTGDWLNEIIKDFASKSKINLKEKEGKNRAVDLATKEKKELSKTLEKLKNKKTKKGNATDPVVTSVKTEDDKVAQQEKTGEMNELANFFSKNLSGFKKKELSEEKPKEEVIEINPVENKKEEPEKIPVLVETKTENKEYAPNRSFVEEEKAEPVKEETEESSLSKMIAREKSRYQKINSEQIKEEKKEKKTNKWRNIKAWALGLLGLGATAYGIKEYSEKETIDSELNIKPKYENVVETKEQKKEVKEKEVRSKKTNENQEKRSKIKKEVKEKRQEQETKEVETIKIEKIKTDSSSLEQKDVSADNILEEKAPSFIIETISIYHPELTSEEKNIVGQAYSKVIEYISGDDDIESFYKNISWLNTMNWEIDSTLSVSKKVLAGEYGEVGETEKRMAEYFINFAKRQEEKGLPASGMKTEDYIISGLIKDAGIKKD